MTAVRWIVEHPRDQIDGVGWIEYRDEATAQAHAGTAAKVWAVVTPGIVEAAVSGLSDGGNTDVLALLAEVAHLRERLNRAHEVLAGIGVDEDSCTTLESTVEHVVRAYRAVVASEARAADEIERLRPVYDAAAAWRDPAARRRLGTATADLMSAVDTARHLAGHTTEDTR